MVVVAAAATDGECSGARDWGGTSQGRTAAGLGGAVCALARYAHAAALARSLSKLHRSHHCHAHPSHSVLRTVVCARGRAGEALVVQAPRARGVVSGSAACAHMCPEV